MEGTSLARPALASYAGNFSLASQVERRFRVNLVVVAARHRRVSQTVDDEGRMTPLWDQNPMKVL
jgi:hypothetical protein